MNAPHSVLNDNLNWHESDSWTEALSLLRILFGHERDSLIEIRSMAITLRGKIDTIDRFIEENTVRVCPGCRKVCCINKHGYYDYQDLIYIIALGLEPPAYSEGIADNDPCQFLGETGCLIERSLRPFRCNWHFCSELITFMNSGPAKPLREFNDKFRKLQSLRQAIRDAFFSIVLKRS
jgi:hypothetical protein